jgi:Ca2+-binding EF-hand superfamily protein
MEDYILTEDDIKCCINAIEDLDDDDNGFINVYDFDTALDKLGIELSEIELAKLISELDEKSTGFIQFRDILELYRKKR